MTNIACFCLLASKQKMIQSHLFGEFPPEAFGHIQSSNLKCRKSLFGLLQVIFPLSIQFEFGFKHKQFCILELLDRNLCRTCGGFVWEIFYPSSEIFDSSSISSSYNSEMTSSKVGNPSKIPDFGIAKF